MLVFSTSLATRMRRTAPAGCVVFLMRGVSPVALGAGIARNRPCRAIIGKQIAAFACYSCRMTAAAAHKPASTTAAVKHLAQLDERLRWLSTWTIHHAN